MAGCMCLRHFARLFRVKFVPILDSTILVELVVVKKGHQHSTGIGDLDFLVARVAFARNS